MSDPDGTGSVLPADASVLQDAPAEQGREASAGVIGNIPPFDSPRARRSLARELVAAATESQAKERKRKRYRGRANPTSQSGARAESIRDLSHAIAELEQAKLELAQVPENETRWRRESMLGEPLSRLDLTRRFLESVLKRHRWRAG